MGTVLAMQEHRPAVPDTPTDPRELRDELEHLVGDLEVYDTLGGWGVAIREGTATAMASADYFLVFLNPEKREVTITGFTRAQLPQAQRDYLSQEEKIEGKPGFQACLVSADSVKALPKAYPNFYLDTTAFQKAITRVLNR